MRPADDLERRLAEADFFLAKMEEAGANLFELWCYFDAFVAAARSVTWVLKAVMGRVDGFAPWYDEHMRRLNQEPVARLFVRLRNASQKEGTVAITHGRLARGAIHHYLSDEHAGEATDIDAIEVSRRYMALLVQLVAMAYRAFPAKLDARYSLRRDYLERTGQSVEDVEEGLGFPRGWTKVRGGSEEQRLEVLRSTLPGVGIHDLFERYGVELAK